MPPGRTAVVIGAAVLAGYALGDGATGEAVTAGAVLVLAGAIVNRWWAAPLPPFAVLLIGVAFIVDPGSFDEGREMTAGGVWIITLALAAIAGVAIAAGVAIRRVARHGAVTRVSGASHPRTTRTGSR